MTESGDVRTFEIKIDATATAVGKMRNEVAIELEGAAGKTRWDMATDEGPFHGGDSSAPPPLAYFATGVVACLMTQVRAFAKRLRISIDGVEMTARFHWRGEQRGREPYRSEPVGIGIDIAFDSTETADDLKRLVDAARHGCFAEQIIIRGMPIAHRLRIGDAWVDI